MVRSKISARRINRVAWGARSMLVRGVGSVAEGVFGSVGKTVIMVKRVRVKAVIGVLKEIS